MQMKSALLDIAQQSARENVPMYVYVHMQVHICVCVCDNLETTLNF